MKWIGIIEGEEYMGKFYYILQTDAYNSYDAKNKMAKQINDTFSGELVTDHILCCLPEDAADAVAERILTRQGKFVEDK